MSALRIVTLVGFFGTLFLVAIVDKKTMEIPNEFVGIIAFFGLLAIKTMPELSLPERLIGLLCVSVPLLLITLAIPGAFGGGDIKLMGACGIFLGWKISLLSLFFAVILGGLYGVYLLGTGKKGRNEHFAFGPFLCVGMVIAYYWGEALFEWYLQLCGL